MRKKMSSGVDEDTYPEGEIVVDQDEDIGFKPSLSDHMAIESLAPVSGYLSSGCTLLDLAISDRVGGGVPVGRITEFFGDESSGKSAIVQEILGSAQRQNGIAYYIDAEHTLDLSRANDIFGLETDDKKGNFIYLEPSSIEELFDDTFQQAIDRDKSKFSGPCAVTVDTLSALPSEADLATKLAKGSFAMSRSKNISRGFNKYLLQFSQGEVAMIFVNQTRMDVNATWGPKVTTSGGKALGFYASTRVRLSSIQKIKNKDEEVIGVTIKFDCVKNKVAPPHRVGAMHIIFDYGIDDIGTNLTYLSDKKIIIPRGSWVQFKEHPKQQGFDSLRRYIEENNLEQELREEVARVWHETHKSEDRKPKERW